MLIGRRKFLVFFFLVFLVVIFFQTMSYSKVDRILEKISSQEQLALSDFFRELIENNCFGYTLFGNKPVSCEYYFTNDPVSIRDFLRDRTSYMIHKGQKVWEKNKGGFDLKGFILKFEIEKDYEDVYLINKRAFLSCVATHLDLFRSILGSHVTPESLLNSLAKNGVSLHSLVDGNSVLEGILLGYGKHNALLYSRYSKVSSALREWSVSPPWKETSSLGQEQLSTIDKININMNKRNKVAEGFLKIIPSEDFANLAEEYEWFETKFREGANLRPFRDLSRFSFPVFRMDGESEETQKIIADYLDTKKQMAEIYFSGDFLAITLKKLTGEF